MVLPNRNSPGGIKRLRENIKTIFLSHQSWIENPSIVKSSSEIQRRIQLLEEKYREVSELNDELLLQDESESSEFIVAMESLYLDLVSRLETLLDSRKEDVLSASGSEYRSCANNSPAVRLPKLNLPEFSEGAELWPSFYHCFTSSLRAPYLTDLDRFQYLDSCLKGEAAQVIANIDILEENYQTAINLLRRRYKNKRLNLRKLFLLPAAAASNSPVALRDLVNVSLATVRAIENLGYKRDVLANELIVQLIISKLDSKLCELWETVLAKQLAKELALAKENLEGSTDEKVVESDAYEDLMNFLETRLQVISAVYSNQASKAPVSSAIAKPRQKSVLVTSVQQNSANTSAPASQQPSDHSFQQNDQPRVCTVCQGPHSAFQCPSFQGQIVDERYQTVRRLRLCANCLSSRHWSSACTSSTCRKCSKRHHTLLHGANTGAVPSAPSAAQGSPVANSIVQSSVDSLSVAAVTPSSPSISSVVSAVAHRQASGVLLGTAIVKASYQCRSSSATVLLDGASHVSLITRRLQEKLQSPLAATSTNVTGVGNSATFVRHKTRLSIANRAGTFSIDIALLVVDQITEPLPTETFKTSIDWGFLSGYELADPQYNDCKEIETYSSVLTSCTISCYQISVATSTHLCCSPLVWDGFSLGHTSQPQYQD